MTSREPGLDRPQELLRNASRVGMTRSDFDVLAAQHNGITGVLVKTGKYLSQTHQAASGTPDHVLESIADLPALLADLGVRPA